MRIGRFTEDSVWPEVEMPEDAAAVRLLWLRRWVADVAKARTDPVADEASFTWIVGNVLFRIEGLLMPTGRLRDEFEQLYTRYCSSEADAPVAVDLMALTEAGDKALLADLQGGPSTGEPRALAAQDIAMHCSTSGSARSMYQGGQTVGALEAAVYGPSWLLAWRMCHPGVAALLAIPLRLQHPGFFASMGLGEVLVDLEYGAPHRAAVADAISRSVAHARAAHPGLDVNAEALDYTSVFTLCADLQDALGAADFDPDAAPARDRTGAPDFAATEEALVAGSREAIARFTQTHPDVEVSFFAFDCNPYHGEFLVSVDTTASGTAARDHAAEVVERRQRTWAAPDPTHWRTSRSLARALMPLDYNPVVGEFAHPMFHEICFDWQAFVRSDAYGRLNQGGEDGWLEGHMRLVLARVCDRLVDEGAFNGLRWGPVLRLGYSYHGEPDAMVCRLLWRE